jgi:hypothetical protein
MKTKKKYNRIRRDVQGMPKSREKSVRETHNMTKIRKEKCSAARMANKAKGSRSDVVHSSRWYTAKS